MTKPLLKIPEAEEITVPTITSQRSRALALLGRQPILGLKDFTAKEVDPQTLARLVREGVDLTSYGIGLRIRWELERVVEFL